MNTKILKAEKLENKIQNNHKEEKFIKMIQIQNNFISENMKEGKKSVIWIFSDREYYHNDLERTWFTEFEEKARKLFEKNGYVVSGIVIKW